MSPPLHTDAHLPAELGVVEPLVIWRGRLVTSAAAFI
jgi:hypothetical protein